MTSLGCLLQLRQELLFSVLTHRPWAHQQVAVQVRLVCRHRTHWLVAVALSQFRYLEIIDCLMLARLLLILRESALHSVRVIAILEILCFQ